MVQKAPGIRPEHRHPFRVQLSPHAYRRRWPVTRSERRKRITILVVALAFSVAMLRRGDMAGGSIARLAPCRKSFFGDPGLHFGIARGGGSSKTASRRKKNYLFSFYADDEVRMLKDWLSSRGSAKGRRRRSVSSPSKRAYGSHPETLFDSLNERLLPDAVCGRREGYPPASLSPRGRNLAIRRNVIGGLAAEASAIPRLKRFS